MIIPVAAALAALLPLLLGGRMNRLAAVRLHRTGWVVWALLLQIVVIEMVSNGPPAILKSMHVLSYLMAAAFLWLNRRVPGLLLVGLGAASNGITIAINGGTLPARPGALRTAGIDLVADQFVNSGALAHPHLWFLGDVFAIPASWPLANVFSVGDVLIVLGVAVASWCICGTFWTPPWNAAANGHGPLRPPRHAAAALT
jgi:hypothetical protein